MRYGKRTVIITDEYGNSKQTIHYIKGGKEMPEKREVIEEQKRVKNALEEVAVYHAFSKRYHDDPTMINPSVSVKGRRDANEEYTVILTYMRDIHE